MSVVLVGHCVFIKLVFIHVIVGAWRRIPVVAMPLRLTNVRPSHVVRRRMIVIMLRRHWASGIMGIIIVRPIGMVIRRRGRVIMMRTMIIVVGLGVIVVIGRTRVLIMRGIFVMRGARIAIVRVRIVLMRGAIIFIMYTIVIMSWAMMRSVIIR